MWTLRSASPTHRNALVCSHDHLTLFLTLVAGLEFIRFDLDLVSRVALLWDGLELLKQLASSFLLPGLEAYSTPTSRC